MTLLFSLATIAILWPLIFAYQAAMAFVGRWLGIGVEEVSIGYGPTLCQWRGASEVWRLRLLPLGGYTQFRGGIEHGIEPPAPGFYRAASRGARALVILAGPLANVLLGMLLLGVAVWQQQEQLNAVFADRGSGPPRLTHDANPSTWEGQFQLVNNTAGVYLARLMTFQSLDGWGGPVALSVVAGRTGHDSWIDWLTLIGVVSLTFGCFNLLPIPGMNGFHLVSLACDALLSRVGLRHRNADWMLIAGFLLAFIWMARVLWLDVFWVWRRLGEL